MNQNFGIVAIHCSYFPGGKSMESFKEVEMAKNMEKCVFDYLEKIYGHRDF